MNRALSAAAIILLSLALVLPGCLNTEKACSTNTDCPPGLFCVSGKCSSLECRNSGQSCSSESDCCGLLECTGGACSGSLGDHASKISISENGYAKVYGAVVRAGNISASFGQNCALNGATVDLSLDYGGSEKNAVVSQGSSLEAGQAKVTLDSISGNPLSNACSAEKEEGAIHAERNITFTKGLSVGEGYVVPGTNAKITLEGISPSSSGQLPCRYVRSATLQVSSPDGSYLVLVNNTSPAFYGGSEFTLDAPGPTPCFSFAPVITASLVQSGDVSLKEGGSATLFGDLGISLDKLDVESYGESCAVAGASARVSVKLASSPATGSLDLKLGAPQALSGISLELVNASGVFHKTSKECSLQNRSISITVFSPDGLGGPFGIRERVGSALFIERISIRQERTLGAHGTCPLQMQPQPSPAYSFDDGKQTLRAPLGGAKIAYGVTNEVSRDSAGSGASSFLYAGAAIPFNQGGLSLLGVNKLGDAIMVFADKALVLPAGGSASFVSEGKEQSGDCLISVTTMDTITNHGFVAVSG